MLLPILAQYVQSLTPDEAVGLGTAGICLGLVEFNRPGRILPGALGLLLVLLGAAPLIHPGVRPWAALLLACSVLVLVANAWRRLPLWMLASATLALAISLRFLLAERAASTVHTPVAVVCAAVLGTLGGALTRIAYRARRSKALD